MEYTTSAKLKDGRTLEIHEARPEEAQTWLDFMKRVGGESDNLLYGADGLPLSLEQEKAFLESKRQSPTDCILTGWLDGEAVALCSVSVPDQQRIAHHGDIGLCVAKSHWGLGIGEAMMCAIREVALYESGLHMLHLGVRAGNEAAIALYKKLGFVEYGRFPHFFCINGEFHDEIEMALMLTDEGGDWS